jgi:hypothetical protein
MAIRAHTITPDITMKDGQWANGGPYRAVAELPSQFWEFATLPYNNGLTILRKNTRTSTFSKTHPPTFFSSVNLGLLPYNAVGMKHHQIWDEMGRIICDPPQCKVLDRKLGELCVCGKDVYQ